MKWLAIQVECVVPISALDQQMLVRCLLQMDCFLEQQAKQSGCKLFFNADKVTCRALDELLALFQRYQINPKTQSLKK
jgi:hypothetical protein